MEDLNKELEEIQQELKEIDMQLDEIEKYIQENKGDKNETPFGIFSIVDDRVKIELLMDESFFNEEDLAKLQQIAQDMQDLLVEVYRRENE